MDEGDVDDSAREPPAITASRISNAPSSSTRTALLLACSVGFVVVAFLFGPRPAKTTARGSTRAQSAAAVSAAALTAEQVRTAPPPSSAATASKMVPATVSRSAAAKSAEGVRSVETRAEAIEPAESGMLRITADPRAAIEITGSGFHQLQQTPLLGLKVPVGKYQVVFRNDTFGTPISAQVVVVAGASRSVHADFRQAEPTVTVR
jgi:hypothetical protein